jgi:hypothetical protein
MSGPTPSETYIRDTAHSEDGLSIESQDEDQGDGLISMETPSDTLPPPDNIQDGPVGESSGSEIWPSDDFEDFVHVNTGQPLRHSSPPPGTGGAGLVPPPGAAPPSDPISTTASHRALSTHGPNEGEPATYDMQLVHVPRPSHHRLSRYPRAERDQAGQGSSQPPPPPLNLFGSSGIAYTNEERVQLLSVPLFSPYLNPPQPVTWPYRPGRPPYPQPYNPFAPSLHDYPPPPPPPLSPESPPQRLRPMPPPLNLFGPSGIAYLNGEWMQLSSAPLSSPSLDPYQPVTWPSRPDHPPYLQPYNPLTLPLYGYPPPPPPPFWPKSPPPRLRPRPHVSYRSVPPPSTPPIWRRRAALNPTSGDEAIVIEEHVKPRKTYNPFDSSDSEDGSRGSRYRLSNRSRSMSRSRSRSKLRSRSGSNRSESTASDSSSSTSTSGSRKPFMHLFPKLKNKKPGRSGGESAAAEWEQQKRELGEKNKPLDRLMAMEGLEEVKREFLSVKATIDEARKRKGRLRRQDLNLVLLGNAGTGMTCPKWMREKPVPKPSIDT